MEDRITIDATGQTLGRVASDAAVRLRGKDRASFQPNRLPGVTVEITNAAQMRISEEKLDSTIYQRYSGYPSGRKTETLRSLVSRRGYAEALRRTVHGMLPSNRLRDKLLKQLIVTE